MRIFFFILLSACYFLNLSCRVKFDNTKPIPFIVNEQNKIIVQDSLNSFNITQKIVSFLHNIGSTNGQYHCLNSNSKCIVYHDTTDIIAEESHAFFSYSFLDTINNELKISLNKFAFGTPSMRLKLNIKGGNFTSNLYSLDLDDDSIEDSNYQTNKCQLILNKHNYQLGDTIYGYTFYQGSEMKSKSRLRKWKYKIFFKSIVGTKQNLSDIISGYPTCQGYKSAGG